MRKTHGSWTLGICRRIYNGNLKEQSLLGRLFDGGKMWDPAESMEIFSSP